MDTHNTHSKRWIVDRATLKQARADDLQYVDEPEYLDFLAIYFANGMSHLPPHGRRNLWIWSMVSIPHEILEIALHANF